MCVGGPLRKVEFRMFGKPRLNRCEITKSCSLYFFFFWRLFSLLFGYLKVIKQYLFYWLCR